MDIYTSDQLPSDWIVKDAEGTWLVRNVAGALHDPAHRRPYLGGLSLHPVSTPEVAAHVLRYLGAEIVSVTEIAQRAGTTPGTVHSWRRRHGDFPAPLAELAVGPVWSWPDVEAWIAQPRPTGRRRR